MWTFLFWCLVLYLVVSLIVWVIRSDQKEKCLRMLMREVNDLEDREPKPKKLISSMRTVMLYLTDPSIFDDVDDEDDDEDDEDDDAIEREIEAMEEEDRRNA